MPPPGIAASLFFSGICVTTASVVSSNDAIDDACCRAERTSLAESITRLHKVLVRLGLRVEDVATLGTRG